MPMWKEILKALHSEGTEGYGKRTHRDAPSSHRVTPSLAASQSQASSPAPACATGRSPSRFLVSTASVAPSPSQGSSCPLGPFLECLPHTRQSDTLSTLRARVEGLALCSFDYYATKQNKEAIIFTRDGEQFFVAERALAREKLSAFSACLFTNFTFSLPSQSNRISLRAPVRVPGKWPIGAGESGPPRLCGLQHSTLPWLVLSGS